MAAPPASKTIGARSRPSWGGGRRAVPGAFLVDHLGCCETISSRSGVPPWSIGGVYAGHRPIDEDGSASAGVVNPDIQLCLLERPCAGISAAAPPRRPLFCWSSIANDIFTHARMSTTEAIAPSGARAAYLARLGVEPVEVKGSPHSVPSCRRRWQSRRGRPALADDAWDLPRSE